MASGVVFQINIVVKKWYLNKEIEREN